MNKRFMRRGVMKIYVSPTCADIHNITRAELTAAEDITDEVADTSGWTVENSAIQVPDAGSRFAKNIPGEDSAADSSLTFWEGLDDDWIIEILPKGFEGFVFIARKGDQPGSLSLGGYPIRVASNSAEISMGNDGARAVVSCTITDEPELDGPVPAKAA
jgi:hypothetical protein